MPSLSLTRIALVCCVLSTSACADILGLGDFTFGDGGNSSTSTTGGSPSDGGNGAGPSNGGMGGTPVVGGMGGAGGEGGVGGSPGCAGDITYDELVKCDEPILYFRFEDDDATGFMVNEVTSDVGDGVYGTAASIVEGVPATAGNAVRVGNGRCDVPDPAGAIDFLPFEAFTMEAWVRADDSAELGTFGYFGTWDGDQGYSLFVFPGSTAAGESPNLEFKRNAQPNIIQCASAPVCQQVLDFNEFRHVVATYDGAMQATLYIDGIEVTSALLSNALEVSRASFALVGPAPTNGEDEGLVFDEVAIYDHALSAKKIESHFDCGNGAGCKYTD